MNPRRSAPIVLVALLILVFLVGRTGPVPAAPLRAVLCKVDACTRTELAEWKDGGANGVVLVLESSEAAFKERTRAAAELVRAHDLSLHYWIEIARDPALAEAHPGLMAGLQGHDNWRVDAPSAPIPSVNEHLKAWPWVSILYAAAFDLQLAKIEERVAALPVPDGLFLNDLQGAPSACGCGNEVCRWTTDYLAEPSLPLSQFPVAERFLARVRSLHAGVRIVPVWTRECGTEGGRASEACHGVPCATGRCWPALVDEIRPLAQAGSSIGLLLAASVPVDPPGAGEDRDEPVSAEKLEERFLAPVVEGLRGFPADVAKHGLELSSKRLIPILRGWDASSLAGIGEQTEMVVELGAHEWVVALTAIDQGWEPRLVRAEAR